MPLPIRDMQIKTSLRFPFTLIRMAKISQQMPVHAGRMHGNRNTYPLMMGVQTGTNTMEISVMVTQELKFDLPRDTAVSALGVYPKDFPSSCRDTCPCIFIATPFQVART